MAQFCKAALVGVVLLAFGASIVDAQPYPYPPWRHGWRYRYYGWAYPYGPGPYYGYYGYRGAPGYGYWGRGYWGPQGRTNGGP